MLSDQILSAQSGSKTDMLSLIEKFSPVIKKYGKKLDPEDGISEITLYFIELIHHLNIHRLNSRSDGAIVNYVAQSISHFYVKMKAGPYDNHFLYLEELTDAHRKKIESAPTNEDFPFDWTLPLQALTDKERLVIIHIYEHGFSSAEIAKYLGVSRQNINQIKKRAESKIRTALIERNQGEAK